VGDAGGRGGPGAAQPLGRGLPPGDHPGVAASPRTRQAARLPGGGRRAARAKLRQGRTCAVAVAPGHHRLYRRLDWWLRCPEVEVTLAPGASAGFLCRPRGGVMGRLGPGRGQPGADPRPLTTRRSGERRPWAGAGRWPGPTAPKPARPVTRRGDYAGRTMGRAVRTGGSQPRPASDVGNSMADGSGRPGRPAPEPKAAQQAVDPLVAQAVALGHLHHPGGLMRSPARGRSPGGHSRLPRVLSVPRSMVSPAAVAVPASRQCRTLAGRERRWALASTTCQRGRAKLGGVKDHTVYRKGVSDANRGVRARGGGTVHGGGELLPVPPVAVDPPAAGFRR
jgi:hypothetical protein